MNRWDADALAAAMHRHPAGKAFDRHAAEALAIVAADRAAVIDIRSREVIA